LQAEDRVRQTDHSPEESAQFCTCGAQLPPDARFCHKCGKPQFEENAPAVEPEIAETASRAPEFPQAVSAPALPSFHNPVAVRTAFLAASVAALLSSTPYVSLGCAVWFFAGGFFAVYLFRRRTGQLLSVRDGGRMGWITGVFTFLIITVLTTISAISTGSSGGIGATLREQLRSMPMGDGKAEEALRMLETPGGVAAVIFFSLVLVFVSVMLLCVAGGAAGAKVLQKD